MCIAFFYLLAFVIFLKISSLETDNKTSLRKSDSAENSYMSAERTLAAWVRTALSTMVFGIAIDKLGLLLNALPQTIKTSTSSQNHSPQIVGYLLVIASIFMALASGIRFILFTQNYQKEFYLPVYHKTWLPVAFAFMTVFFGVLLILLMMGVG